MTVNEVSGMKTKKLPAKKKDFRSGKNISRIYLKNPPEITDKPVQKIINDLLNVKLTQLWGKNLMQYGKN